MEELRKLLRGFFAQLQSMGQALMVPVAVLPVAGLFLGIGSANFSWMPSALSLTLKACGSAVFSSLPLIFAVGVAGPAAALAALVGFMVLIASMAQFAVLFDLPTRDLLGFATIETGVLGGLLVGFLAKALYGRYHELKLPAYLGFFAGSRLIPILTAFASLFLAMILAAVWPPIQSLIREASNWSVQSYTEVMVFVYGAVERLLIPFGLHHIWNVPFFFEIGAYVDATGKTVHGDISRFFAGDPTAGILAGGYFVKMFGLPGAALAIWTCARPEHKTFVGGIMLSAAFTSFLTGITEPIEFSFLFVAPLLYVLHSLIAGSLFVIAQLLEIKHSTTFSHGLIDFTLYYSLAHKPWQIALYGPVVFGFYFLCFRTAILYFDLKTPGRDLTKTSDKQVLEQEEFIEDMVFALGGAQNILETNACITRLRLKVKDPKRLEVKVLEKLSHRPALVVGQSVQVVFGTQSEAVKVRLQNFLSELDSQPTKRQAATALASPMMGRIIPLSEVPDEVFSQKIMGDGFAIVPDNHADEVQVRSPVSGVVTALLDTRHAIGITSGDGKEVLIHVGIDTVKLKGQGFQAHVKKGDLVRMGDLLLSVNMKEVAHSAPSTITPVIITNLSENETFKVHASHDRCFVAHIETQL